MTETHFGNHTAYPGARRSSSRWLLLSARALSTVFRPSFYPTVAFFVLLTFTFLRMLPFVYRLCVLAVVYILTYAVPYFGVRFYRRTKGLSKQQLRERKARIVPYAIHIVSYLVCLDFVWRMRLPSFLLCVIVISIILQAVCTVISFWWKISVHSAAVGTVIGGLVVYSSVFAFNPVWWLSGAILLSGLVNSSRMLLRQHSLWQVLGGTLVGIGCGLLGTLIVQI
ncbi:MAG: phosphatase PAP2 family protein [Prevotellaceae bacterium]|nr:phosphatase PAP2 family protein [Prevotellaceae bacterium]